MPLRKLDTSRPYGALCPPGPGGAYVQDHILFDIHGVEIAPPEEPRAQMKAQVEPSAAPLEPLEHPEPIRPGQGPVEEANPLPEIYVGLPLGSMTRAQVMDELQSLGVTVDKRKSDVTLRRELFEARNGRKG